MNSSIINDNRAYSMESMSNTPVALTSETRKLIDFFLRIFGIISIVADEDLRIINDIYIKLNPKYKTATN